MPDNHVTILAGCGNLTIQVTPWWNDTPTEGDVIVSIFRVGRPFSVVDQGVFSKNDAVVSGIFQSHQFHYRFNIGEFDLWEPESIFLSDMYGTQALIRYYYKCVHENNYTLLNSFIYNGTNGPVVIGSLSNYISTFDLVSVPNSYTNTQGFTVHDNLNIDVPDYCFLGQGGYTNGQRHLRMTPGSKITVKSGNTLKIKNNYMISCDGQRWNSIFVESGATLILEGTTLDNGHYEVNAMAGSTIISTGSIFKDGAIGIRAEDGATILVTQSDFVFSGSLNTYYPNEPAITGSRTNAGIDAQGSYIKVSDGSSFLNLLNGIRGINSRIISENSQFSEISDYGTNNWGLGNAQFYNGKGIHAFATNGANLTVSNCIFDDVMCGIYTKGVNANIHENNMDEMLTGMQFDHSPGRNFDIKGNTISAEARGINFSWTGEVQSTLINEENEINITGQNGIGIDLTETKGLLKLIYENQVSVGEGQIGINLLNSQNFWNYNNTILSNGNLGRPNFGIGIYGGRNNTTLCNLLSSTNSGSANTGLFVTDSPNGGHAGNLALGWHFDFHFVGDALGTVFGANHMDDANHGLSLGYPLSQIGSMIGPQTHMGNRWIGSHTIGAYNYGGLFDRLKSKFIVNAEDISNPDLKPNNFTENVSRSWFGHDSAANHFTLNCGTVGAGFNPVPRSFPRSDDEFVAIGVYDTAYDWGTRIWSSKRQLYAELLERGSLQSYPSIYGSFFSANAATTVGRFEQIERGIHQAYFARNNDYITINDWLAEEDSIFSLALGILTELATEEDSSTLVSLLDDLSVLSESLQDLQSDRSLLAAEIDSLLAIPLGNLEVLNDTLTISEDYEEYQQYVNVLYFNMLVDSDWELDSTQRVEIEYISELCPYFAGPARISCQSFAIFV